MRCKERRNIGVLFVSKPFTRPSIGPYCKEIGPDSNYMNQSYEQKYVHAKLSRVCAACGFKAEYGNNPARSLTLKTKSYPDGEVAT